ncbi:MAG TPA: methyltransferase domain-containing protein [Flavobacterium sp.]|jgi:2-polyprenyl-3-methyl-5-hydroxy-6-metoxy-1,4-benzoquinol methylase
MTTIDTKQRTTATETMDDFSMEGEILRDALDKIAKINQLLGGNALTVRGVKKLLHGVPKSQVVTIVDVGCGNGDMLRELAEFGKSNDRLFNLIGIDANQFTVNHAESLSEAYPNISYRCKNVFDLDFANLNPDIVLCTLTLHHFRDDEILTLTRKFKEYAAIGVVINDLHRSKLAYRLFQLVCSVFGLNDMSREDGLVSILRGFKKEELTAFSKQLNLKKYSIRWKWAFRYQWIISNI